MLTFAEIQEFKQKYRRFVEELVLKTSLWNIRMFKTSFKIILIFCCASPVSRSYSFFFLFSLSCLLFLFSSFLLCMIPNVLLSFYCFCMTRTVFMFVVLLLIYVFSSWSFFLFPCCSFACSSSMFLLPLNAKNNKQATTKHKHWE